MRSPFECRRGSALLIVLGMVAFMVISSVAFSAYMRYSRLPSSYLRRASSSRLLVKAALAEAIDEIDAAIGDNLHPNVGRRAPRAGVGAASADQNGVQNESLMSRNAWAHRVYLGTNSVSNLLEPDRTVSTLSLEGLAYIPPPLVNYARYYSRRSTAATWKSLGFDAGRYAFCAIDVSDCLDVNVVSANFGRGSSPATRISLAHVFEASPDHGSYTRDPAAWDTFLKKFWARTPAEAAIGSVGQQSSANRNGSQRVDANKVPLVSVADLNLALFNDTSTGFKSPFCDFVWNDRKMFYNGDHYTSSSDCSQEGDFIHRMSFVTDSFFPRTASTGAIDLSDETGQPFTRSLLDQDSPAYGSIISSAAESAVKLRDRISALGLVMLYDYLDDDNVPVSLSIPSVERVPMIAAIEPKLPGSQVAFADNQVGGQYVVETQGAMVPETKVANELHVQTVTEYKLNPAFAAPGQVKVVATYPFRRGPDLLGADSFKVDGRIALFFTSEDMGFRPGAGDGLLKIKTTGNQIEMDSPNAAVISAALAEQPYQVNEVNPQKEDDTDVIKEINLPISPADLAPAVNGTPFLTVVRQRIWPWVPDPSRANGGYYQDPGQNAETIVEAKGDGSAQTKFGIPPLKADGTVDPTFTTPAAVVGWLQNGKDISLRMAVWLRVRNGEGKTVDLAPASMADDRNETGQNSNNNMSMGPAGAVQLGMNNPLLRFTGCKVNVSAAGPVPVDGPTAPFNLQPTAVMCPDPRWNWAPEHWCTVASATRTDWLTNCGRDTDGRDCDIFMATSDAGYLQSVYELAFLPRITDQSGNRLASNGLFGNIEPPADGRPDWAANLAGVRNQARMWTTYRPFPHEGAARDPLEEIGLVNEGGGFRITPYSDDTNVVMAAFANTPVDWWAAATEADTDVGVPMTDRGSARNFNKKYAFSAMNNDARFAWKDLEQVAGGLMGKIYGSGGLAGQMESDVDLWEDLWDNVSGNGLDWDGENSWFCGVQTKDGNTDELFDVDRKFLYGYWRECFAVKQQLFLVFVRAEPMMMGGGQGKIPPQLGARAVALVWRDPYANSLGKPHQTRVLFYRQLD